MKIHNGRMTNQNDSSQNPAKNDASSKEPKLEIVPDSQGSAETNSNSFMADLEKAKSDYLYLYAEFENYKKNAIKERSDLRKFGAERLAVEILNVLDIFETALQTQPTAETLDSYKKGIEMTAVELKNALLRNGIEEIPSQGAPFNPAHHEALSQEETDDLPEGYISRVFKKPYKLFDRVIRPGQVVVSKKRQQ